mmetsp:Transcript_8865/g.21914  ORF Transcript_8865/g.21914 Transcript_8865/m.21914 type:complete len:346 (-) Transcript_8865:458-1495(-)
MANHASCTSLILAAFTPWPERHSSSVTTSGCTSVSKRRMLERFAAGRGCCHASAPGTFTDASSSMPNRPSVLLLGPLRDLRRRAAASCSAASALAAAATRDAATRDAFRGLSSSDSSASSSASSSLLSSGSCCRHRSLASVRCSVALVLTYSTMCFPVDGLYCRTSPCCHTSSAAQYTSISRPTMACPTRPGTVLVRTSRSCCGPRSSARAGGSAPRGAPPPRGAPFFSLHGPPKPRWRSPRTHSGLRRHCPSGRLPRETRPSAESGSARHARSWLAREPALANLRPQWTHEKGKSRSDSLDSLSSSPSYSRCPSTTGSPLAPSTSSSIDPRAYSCLSLSMLMTQ